MFIFSKHKKPQIIYSVYFIILNLKSLWSGSTVCYFCLFSLLLSGLCDWSYLTMCCSLYLKNNLGMFVKGCGSLDYLDDPNLGGKFTQGLVYFWLFICLRVQAFGSQFNIFREKVRLPSFGGPQTFTSSFCFLRPPKQHLSFACVFMFDGCCWVKVTSCAQFTSLDLPSRFLHIKSSLSC